MRPNTVKKSPLSRRMLVPAAFARLIGLRVVTSNGLLNIECDARCTLELVLTIGWQNIGSIDSPNDPVSSGDQVDGRRRARSDFHALPGPLNKTAGV
jgi:hypothetical protein